MTIASNRLTTRVEDLTINDDLTVTDDATITDDLTVSGTATVAENLGVGSAAAPNLGGNGAAVTVSAGVAGAVNPARVEIQGSKTTDVTFGVLDYYHQANRVARIATLRAGANDSGSMSFNVAAAGVLGEYMAVTSAGRTTFPLNQAKAVVSGGAVTSFAVSSLLGNTDKLWQFAIFIINANASDTDMYIRPNGGTSNQVSVYMYNSGAAVTAGTDTSLYIGTVRASSQAYFYGTIKADAANGRRFYHSQGYTDTGGTDDRSLYASGVWQESSTEMTSLTILSSTATGIANDSYCVLYRPYPM